jgi:alkyl hydroperoxide reductase subunit AhpC
MPIVTKHAPGFTTQAVVGNEIKEVSLSDYAGKWVYLFFYPFDFTFVCPTEIIAFSNAADKFRELNTQVLGCSIDSAFVHQRWIETPRKEGGLGGITFPLLADVNKNIATAYDVLHDDGMALRGSYLIDPNGVIRHQTVNDLPVGRSVDEALRLISAFQYTDEHGEVCPADWTQGDDTIKPEPEGSKEYFRKQA